VQDDAADGTLGGATDITSDGTLDDTTDIAGEDTLDDTTDIAGNGILEAATDRAGWQGADIKTEGDQDERGMSVPVVRKNSVSLV
jgi:hypothetical protein